MIAAAPAKPQPVPVAAARPYAQVEDVAADALAGLQPVVVVNRRTDTAIRQVDGAADRPFPTLHSDARGDVMTRLRRVTRGVNERLRGGVREAGHQAPPASPRSPLRRVETSSRLR